eukprot:CAMPEP_0177484034 /NCGR_PEP_ID=MMETSP0369-20130122/27803_1 /TAXON_ID=447022 ORGANISM="Scrippsiella hangoei-like, Strain SHHI-4" /NCGR_SAMPLE_ID=MMETSP0369 /ASSEMBLY_ACC=CAM_ASM_000364 /LENGTH=66 /DNA_ID=CAMNT_0018960101 /DNA_START=847 /DNA_END=1044 /DNA_ORIENTATION=-
MELPDEAPAAALLPEILCWWLGLHWEKLKARVDAEPLSAPIANAGRKNLGPQRRTSPSSSLCPQKR